MNLTGKTILILSPQSWGKMFVSKHHYAIELAKRGNTVYFLNPPDQKRPERIVIEPSGVHDNLYFIHHKLNFSYNLKFRLRPLFHWLMSFHIKKVVAKINKPLSIVWSFDLGFLYPFRFFDRNSLKVFHPVDEPLNKTAIDSSEGADIIFSVTHEILEKYNRLSAPKHFINHGVSADFLSGELVETNNSSIRIGFSGNLLRNDIDRPIVLQIIKDNPTLVFEFWGSFSFKDANIGGATDEDTKRFIDDLKTCKNVVLHGAIPSHQLAIAMREMDALLICYDIEKDQSKGTNYHKVMEYLSTGRVVISNNITTYDGRPELIQMTSERSDNNSLPVLFKHVINNLSEYNSLDKQRIRRTFAADNTYPKQVDRIVSKISMLKP